MTDIMLGFVLLLGFAISCKVVERGIMVCINLAERNVKECNVHAINVRKDRSAKVAALKGQAVQRLRITAEK